MNNKIFYKYISVVFALLLTYSGFATTYYVSSSNGNDLNSGKSEQQAWESLTRVNKVYNFEPGDKILFKRGDSWEGTLIINVSGTSENPIIFGAYGDGDKPIIYGSETITGWTKYNENILSAKVVKNVTQLFFDGQMMMAARTPNSGCIYPDIVISENHLSSSMLDSTIDYKGANFISRTLRYRYYGETVTESEDNEIKLSGSIQGELSVNEGFVLTNKLEFLDSPGEWYYNNSTQTVYFWPPSEMTTEDNFVRATNYDYNVFVKEKKFIVIKDLHLKHSAYSSIYQTSSENITYDNCEIDYPNVYGILLSGGLQRHVNITNNTISNSSSDGITVSCNKANISNNNISNIGLFSLIGYECPSTSTAIRVRGDSCSISYNQVQHVAYNGISFAGKNTEVSFNFFNYTNKELDDGASIYTYQRDENDDSSAGSKIQNNIILNCLGSAENCYQSNYGLSYGIYLDKNSNHILVDNNTVAYCQGGLMLGESTSDNFIRGNVFFDFALGTWINSNAPANGLLKANIFYGVDKVGNFVWWNNKNQRLIKLDTEFKLVADSNIYIQHYNATDIFDSDDNGNFEPFSSWQAQTKQDKNSICITKPLASEETERLFYNNTKREIRYNLGAKTYKDIYGNVITGEFVLKPYTSIIIKGKYLDLILPFNEWVK